LALARGVDFGIARSTLSTTHTLPGIVRCKRCFEGASDFDRMLAVVRGTFERPSAVLPDFPRDLEHVIQTALANDPADRFASCGALVAALEQILCDRGWAGGASAIRRAMQIVFGAARAAALPAPIPTRRQHRIARGSSHDLAFDDEITAGRRSIQRITSVLPEDRTFQGSNS